MTDKINIADKDKFYDRFMQPDSNVFHRLGSLRQTLTDKKENKICQRIAFLKNSKNKCSTFACPSARADAPAGKRAAHCIY